MSASTHGVSDDIPRSVAVDRLKNGEVRAALLAQAGALRAQAEVLEALAIGLAASEPGALLDLGELQQRFHLGRSAVRQAIGRGELTASRGAKGKILVRQEDVEAWLAERPVVITSRASGADTEAVAEWERAQERQLNRAIGCGSSTHPSRRSVGRNE